jgi:4,5-dihydroxyphthalate decarboxylase
MDKLTVALGEYPHVEALLGGHAEVAGYEIEPVQVRPIIGAYRRMVRDLEFDVCEMAPVTYLMAREAGVAITGIPVFLNRRFHHGDVQCGARSGIQVPKDLQGRRIGVRAYTVSTCVWVRGVLSSQYGVDVDSITWVTDDDDHVEGRTPATVERVQDGRSLGQMLQAGDLDAALTGNAGTGRAGKPESNWADTTATAGAGDVEPYPLFAQGEALGVDWYLRTGIYPLHSMVVLRTELAEQDPQLPTSLYAALAESKRRQVGADPQWSTQKRLSRQGHQIGGDPIPYGVTANATSLSAMADFAAAQGLLDPGGTGDLKALFAAGDYPDA